MSNARISLFSLLLALVSGASLATGQEANSPLAEPRSLDQTGFPHELYGWLTPADNPQTPAKVALGKELFFDKRLSEDNTQACASCHKPDKGFTDQQPTSDGIHKQFGRRNAPTVLNAAFNVLQFWDGREPTLEEQAKDPIVNPIEMGMKNFDDVVAKVGAISEYQAEFKAVFGATGDVSRSTARARRLRAEPGFLQHPLRSLPGRRRKGNQRSGPARLVNLQRQGALHVVSRSQPDTAALQRQPLP